MARGDASISGSGGLPDIGPAVRSAAREASPVLERLARVGYAARGIVYVLMGIIAIQAALSPFLQRPTDSEGALRVIYGAPAGRVILGLAALGLVGYGVWRLLQAALSSERDVVAAKTWARRIGYAVSGIIHLGLSLQAARLALGDLTAADGNEEARDWTAAAMQYGIGRWAVLAVGLIMIGVGAREIARAFGTEFTKHIQVRDLPPHVRRNLERLGAFGTAARGVVFGLVGWFLIQAAWRQDSDEARGIGGALRTLQEQPYGPALLGTMAVGLIGFGVWQLVNARYRRLRVG